MTKAEIVTATDREIEITQRAKDSLIGADYVTTQARVRCSGRIRGLELAMSIVKMLMMENPNDSDLLWRAIFDRHCPPQREYAVIFGPVGDRWGCPIA